MKSVLGFQCPGLTASSDRAPGGVDRAERDRSQPASQPLPLGATEDGAGGTATQPWAVGLASGAGIPGARAPVH